jgi:hypothetical protein
MKVPQASLPNERHNVVCKWGTELNAEVTQKTPLPPSYHYKMAPEDIREQQCESCAKRMGPILLVECASYLLIVESNANHLSRVKYYSLGGFYNHVI